MLLFDMHADFFGRFVLRRNYFIRRVLLVLLVPTTSTTSTTSTTRTTSSSSSTGIASTTCDLATLVMRDHGQCVPNRHPTLPKS